MSQPHSKYIEKTKQDYAKLGYEPYQWFRAENLPAFAQLQKPLSESKLGLISTAGTYVKGQKAFFTKDDTSIRRIKSSTPLDKIRFAHIMQNYLVEASLTRRHKLDDGTKIPPIWVSLFFPIEMGTFRFSQKSNYESTSAILIKAQVWRL